MYTSRLEEAQAILQAAMDELHGTPSPSVTDALNFEGGSALEVAQAAIEGAAA